MTRTYSDFTSETRSSKLVLCHVEPVQRLSVFALESGTIYSKTTNHFVIDVVEDGTSLTEASSASLSTGEWYYDPATSKLWVNSSDDLDPKKHRLVATYRLFFSSGAIDLPHDLVSGSDVNYDGRLRSNSPVKKELDDEQVGVVLESATSVSFNNSDGYFDNYYDTLIFENKAIKLYSWSETIPLSEKRKIFDGTIKNKTFSKDSIRFSCKDFVYSLRQPVVIENFTASDGTVRDRYINKPKRRIYGEFKSLQCTPTDSIIDGYALTGTCSVAFPATSTVVGVGTSFLSEVSKGDTISIFTSGVTYSGRVADHTTDTSLTLEEAFPVLFTAETVTLKPDANYQGKNRTWHIAGHKLRASSTTMTTVTSQNRFSVADSTEFFAGDFVSINGEGRFILRVSSGNVVLVSNLTVTPSDGDTMSKSATSGVYVNGREAVLTRDYTVTNTDTNAYITLEDSFEFNLAPVSDMNTQLTFTNGSNSLTVVSGNPLAELKTRDWIRSGDVSHTTWYEVLNITETLVTIRASYGGGTGNFTGEKKTTDIIDDDAIVTIDCVGMDRSDKWVKTASDVVLDLIENDVALTNINTSSFATAAIDSSAVVSLAIPSRIGGNTINVKTAITRINKSAFGSLVLDSDFNMKYTVLSPDRDSAISEIKDDDLLDDATINTKNETVNKVNGKYSFFVDKFDGGEANDLYEYTSEFVTDMIGSSRELDIDLYLFNYLDAETVTQRYALYNSLSQSNVTIKGKLNLQLYELNDKVYINLDRIYKRFSSSDSRKIGIVNKVTSDGRNTTLEINDLGNTFNRVGVICDNAAVDFSSATEDDKINNSYIVDDDILTPDITSDTEIYNNIIG